MHRLLRVQALNSWVRTELKNLIGANIGARLLKEYSYNHSPKSWLRNLNKFKNYQGQNDEKNQLKEVVIEEPQVISRSDPVAYNLLEEMKYYLRTTEVPLKLRKGILRDKLSVFVNQIDNSDMLSSAIMTINRIFLHLGDINRNSDRDSKKVSAVLKHDDLIKLFEKSFLALHSKYLRKEDNEIPEYMFLLVQHFLNQNAEYVPPSIYAKMVILGSQMKTGVRTTLELFFRKKSDIDTPQFVKCFLGYLAQADLLTLTAFEDILYVGDINPHIAVVNDCFVWEFIKLGRQIFEKAHLLTYDFRKTELSVDRAQFLLKKVLKQRHLKRLSIRSRFQLLKITKNFDSIRNRTHNKEFYERILDSLIDKGTSSDAENKKLEEIRKVIISEQNILVPTLSEILEILSSQKTKKYPSLISMLIGLLNSKDIKIPTSLKIQAVTYDLLLREPGLPEEQLAQKASTRASEVIEATQGKENEIPDKSYLMAYENIVKITMSCGVVKPVGVFTKKLNELLPLEHAEEPSVDSYKYRLDAAIVDADVTQALAIFDECSRHHDWPCIQDARVACSLNNLVILLCERTGDIHAFFLLFIRIKQQMGEAKCNLGAVVALSKKMIEWEYVGDVIEMLKRELPSIDKEDPVKLPVDNSYSEETKELFDTLFSFTTTYEKEKTYETNWVLYGELHKYFVVPSTTHIKALKFFCEKGRLNASLKIFRQVRKMNDLYEKYGYMPPLREMYLYLFQKFGEHLYEEGIEEIHQYLKMDISMPKQDITLQNAILNAYSNLQDVGKAKDLFISMSSVPNELGGINEETVQIMIKTYTYSDMMYVERFWNNLSQYGIYPNYPIYRQFLIAHVYHGLIDEAIELVENMEDYDLKVTFDTLLSLHNYCLDREKQELISHWAEKNHGPLWNEVVASGLLRHAGKYLPDASLISNSNDPSKSVV